MSDPTALELLQADCVAITAGRTPRPHNDQAFFAQWLAQSVSSLFPPAFELGVD